MDVTELLWDEHNEAHIARHGVEPEEVEEVIMNPVTRWGRSDTHRPGRLIAFGRTAVGRALLVVLDAPAPGGRAYVVTARSMTSGELRDFEAGRKP